MTSRVYPELADDTPKRWDNSPLFNLVRRAVAHERHRSLSAAIVRNHSTGLALLRFRVVDDVVAHISSFTADRVQRKLRARRNWQKLVPFIIHELPRRSTLFIGLFNPSWVGEYYHRFGVGGYYESSGSLRLGGSWSRVVLRSRWEF